MKVTIKNPSTANRVVYSPAEFDKDGKITKPSAPILIVAGGTVKDVELSKEDVDMYRERRKGTEKYPANPREIIVGNSSAVEAESAKLEDDENAEADRANEAETSARNVAEAKALNDAARNAEADAAKNLAANDAELTERRERADALLEEYGDGKKGLHFQQFKNRAKEIVPADKWLEGQPNSDDVKSYLKSF